MKGNLSLGVGAGEAQVLPDSRKPREPEWLVGYELKNAGFAEMESKLQLRNRVNLG